MLVATAAALSSAPSAAMSAPMAPTVDPFYAAPAALASYPAGAILRSRQVDVQLGPAPLTGLAAKAYQLLYRTNDARGVPVANVTTIIVPSDPPPDGGRQLISVNDAEDSVDPNCAPSYQLQTGEQSNANLAVETSLAAAQLALGRDLVVPDAEGPKSEYIVTGMEGHATLDSIRAVERFAPAQLHGAATPVGLIGYSGGAHVTAAASELQHGYAPELDIVGVAAGGVPVGNRETVDYLDGSVGAGVLMATSIALDRAFPEVGLYSYLNATGKAFAQQVSSGCASSVFAAPFAHFSDWTTVPHPFDSAVIARVIADNALGHATPTAPTFFYNGVHDELITIKALDELVARYCDGGARIEYFRDPAGLEHIQGVADFYPLALSYLIDRFNGAAVPNSCGPASSHAATGSSQASGRSPTRGCVSARAVLVRPRIPAGVTVRRIVVSLGGRVVKVAHRARTLRISLAGRPPGSVGVELRIIGRLHHRTVTIRERHRYRTCQPSKRS